MRHSFTTENLVLMSLSPRVMTKLLVWNFLSGFRFFSFADRNFYKYVRRSTPWYPQILSCVESAALVSGVRMLFYFYVFSNLRGKSTQNQIISNVQQIQLAPSRPPPNTVSINTAQLPADFALQLAAPSNQCKLFYWVIFRVLFLWISLTN